MTLLSSSSHCEAEKRYSFISKYTTLHFIHSDINLLLRSSHTTLVSSLSSARVSRSKAATRGMAALLAGLSGTLITRLEAATGCMAALRCDFPLMSGLAEVLYNISVHIHTCFWASMLAKPPW